MKSTSEYSEHLDTLIALITYLAITHRKQMRASRLAIRLSLDEGEVTHVLETFKSLFREGQPSKSNPKEPRYTLHLRYALADTGRDDDEEDATDDDGPEPIDPIYLSALLDFASKQARREDELRRQRIRIAITMVAAIVAAVAAISAALVSALL